ncbi:hypothetical protein RRF57_000100 [Xylaria bambusicola]|uniref:Uncharacterized protein n=1 Tax=Xylaria bambusicola TaxID=326684 RepID=A0AAN7U986_9PEZI
MAVATITSFSTPCTELNVIKARGRAIFHINVHIPSRAARFRLCLRGLFTVRSRQPIARKDYSLDSVTLCGYRTVQAMDIEFQSTCGSFRFGNIEHFRIHYGPSSAGAEFKVVGIF